MENKIKITKEEHLWTSDIKLKFCGYGEWVEEIDLIEFEYLGYQARVIRIFAEEPFAEEEAYFGGHLCGYVKIPKEHPYYGKGRDDIDIEVHGGVTYNEIAEDHWIGYDCAHSQDYVPANEHWEKNSPRIQYIRDLFPIPEEYKKYSIFNPAYRNMEYCINTCINMIDHLNNIGIITPNNEI